MSVSPRASRSLGRPLLLGQGSPGVGWGSSLLLLLPFLAACDPEPWLGLCCGLPLAFVLVPLWLRFELRHPGVGVGFLAALVLSLPYFLWDHIALDSQLARLGGLIVMGGDRAAHDLVALAFPHRPLQVRLLLGAALFGGGLGALIGVATGLRRSGRPLAALGSFFGLGALGLAFLQLGPSPADFVAHAERWPPVEAGQRPSPLPATWSALVVEPGAFTQRSWPALPMTHHLARPLKSAGGCELSLSRDVQVATRDVSQGLWSAVLNEPEASTPDVRKTAMTWFEAAGFANRLSEARGLRPAYSIRPGVVRWDVNSEGFRLPTLAELQLAGGVAEAVWTWDSWVEGQAPACGLDAGVGLGQSDGLGGLSTVEVSVAPMHLVRSPEGAQPVDPKTQDAAVGLRLARSGAPLGGAVTP